MTNKLLVVGPSGCGKTHLIKILRELKPDIRPYCLDLDFLGYRPAGGDWTQWFIPESALDVIIEVSRKSSNSAVCAGACTNADSLIQHALSSGFKVIALIPDVQTLTENRKKRGDKPEKVRDSEASFDSWTTRAEKMGLLILESVDQVLTVVKSDIQL